MSNNDEHHDRYDEHAGREMTNNDEHHGRYDEHAGREMTNNDEHHGRHDEPSGREMTKIRAETRHNSEDGERASRNDGRLCTKKMTS